MLHRLFTQHPKSVNETYLEHLGVASSFGGRLLTAGAACLVHGLLPFLFVKTGSNAIRGLHRDLVTHRQRKAPTPPEPGVYLGDAI